MMTGELYFKMARERRLNCYPVDMVSAIPPIPIEM